MRSTFLPALALLALAACNPPAPQPGVSTAALGGMTTLSLDAAEDAVSARLQELGFTVQERRESGVIQAELARGAPDGWASCDRILVTERDDRNRNHWAEPRDRRATVTVRFSELGGQTSVTLTPRFAAGYLDEFDNLPFDRACSSMGVVEPQILAAIGSG